MRPDVLLVGILSALGLLVILGAIIFRAGVRYGVRKSIVSAKRAYGLGILTGRREERVDWIGRDNL